MQSVAWDSISSLNEDGNTESIENDFTFNTQYGFEKVLGTLLGPGPRPRLDNCIFPNLVKIRGRG